jgi:IS6 family transposase
VRVNGRWCSQWRAVDQRGQLIDFRLPARRNAKAARAFMRQARRTVRCYQPMTIITDKAHNYAKVIKELNLFCGPDDAIRHVDRKHLNNRIEGDHGALKQLLRPKRGFRSLTAAKNTLKGIETLRAIKKGHFQSNQVC